jgi:WD40 repeat protein
MKKLFNKLTQKKKATAKSQSLTSEGLISTSHEIDDETVDKDLRWKLERISLNAAPKAVICAAYDPVQKIVAIGTSEGFVHIFGRYGVEYTLYPSVDENARVKTLRFSVNTGYLVGICAVKDKTFVAIWSLKHRALKYRIDCKKSKFTSIVVPVGSAYAYVSSLSDTTSTINAIHISDGTISVFNILRENSTVTCMENHPHHDHFIAVGFADGTCYVYNMLKKEQNVIAYSHPVISDAVTSISWSSTSDSFVVGYASGEVIVWEIQKLLLQQLHSTTPVQQPLSMSIQTPVTVLRNRGPRPVSLHWIG